MFRKKYTLEILKDNVELEKQYLEIIKNISEQDKQNIINITFQIAFEINNNQAYFKDKSQEEVAEWVAEQLRKCGYDTVPMGLSWGVLKDRKE